MPSLSVATCCCFAAYYIFNICYPAELNVQMLLLENVFNIKASMKKVPSSVSGFTFENKTNSESRLLSFCQKSELCSNLKFQFDCVKKNVLQMKFNYWVPITQCGCCITPQGISTVLL